MREVRSLRHSCGTSYEWSLFERLADVRVTGAYAGHQHFLSSFPLVFVSILLLDLEHDLKEVPDVPKELDPARHKGSHVDQ